MKGSSVLHLRPRKSLGQNFLRDENIARKIVATINPQREDALLEIGPGEGALTRHLVQCGRSLTVVDIDERVTAALRMMFPRTGIEVIQGDFLEIDLEAFAREHPGRVRIIGNIPYNITTPILFHVLDHRRAVSDLTIMVQKEVALRMKASPRSAEYGILSVLCGYYAQVEVLFDVSANAFYPRPTVTSSVVHLVMRAMPVTPARDEEFFRAMVRSVFGKRRKTLRNSLRYFTEERGMTPPMVPGLERRPEELTIEELVDLSNRLLAHSPEHLARPALA